MPAGLLVGFDETTGKEAILKIDNGELRVSGSSSGGVPAKSPADTATSMSAVSVFMSNQGGTSFQALKADSNGHLLVSSSSANDSILIKGNDGNDGAGTERTIKTTATGEVIVSDASISTVLGSTNIISTANSDNRLKVEQPQVAFIHSDGELAAPSTTLKAYTDEATAPYTRSLRCSDKGQLHSQLLGLTNIADQTTHEYVKVEADGSLNVKDTSLSKNFVFNTDPSEVIGSGATVSKPFVIMGGCNDVSGVGLTNLNPLQVNNDGVLHVNITSEVDAKASDSPPHSIATTLQGRTTIADRSTGKFLLCDANGQLAVTSSGHTDGLYQAANATPPSEATSGQVVFLGIHDDAANVVRTAKSNSLSELIVSDQAGRFGLVTAGNAQTTLGGTITETKQVVNCGLDNPTNATKITPMKVSDVGNLQVDVINQPDITLKNLDNTLNGDNALVSKSLATTLKGRTTIDDATTGKFLSCDAQGHLQVDIVSGGGGGGGGMTETMTQNLTFVASATLLVSQTSTAEVDLGAGVNCDYLVLTIETDEINSASNPFVNLMDKLKLHQRHDGSSAGITFPADAEYKWHFGLSNSLMKWIGTICVRKPLRYLSLVNSNPAPFVGQSTALNSIPLNVATYAKVVLT